MATLRWIGNAAATTDVWTIAAPSGTIVSQTYSVTINGNSVSYTAGGSDTATIILAGLQTALAASQIPEFLELTPVALPAGGPYTSITLTQKVSGRPTTVSVSTSGAATFSISNTTVATGPNFFDNGKNWSTGSAPANSDTIVFDYGSVDCKYKLSTTLTGIVCSVEQGYSGKIGLPAVNAESSVRYNEYRTTALTLAGGTLTIKAPSCSRCNFAFGSNTATVNIQATGQRAESLVPVVLLTGGDGSSTLDISKGDVGVAFYRGTTATFATIRTTYVSSAKSDVKLVCGIGATLTTITKNGGTLTVNSAVTTLTQEVDGGTTTVTAGAITTLNVQGGTLIYNSTGTLGTLSVSGSSIVTFDQDSQPKTITNPIQVYGEKASISDNKKVVNSGTLSVTTNRATTINVSHGSGNVCTFT